MVNNIVLFLNQASIPVCLTLFSVNQTKTSEDGVPNQYRSGKAARGKAACLIHLPDICGVLPPRHVR